MSRLEVLEKEINKGIAIDEKSSVQVSGWSPNNVRRLIIGFDTAIVQYYVTGGKYRRLMEKVDFGRHCNEDIDSAGGVSNKKYKSVLDVLSKGRVLSSVEEIIFCSKMYPEHILKLDVGGLKGSVDFLKNRYVRLTHVSVADCSVKEMYEGIQAMDNHKEGLLYPKLRGVINLQTVMDMDNKQWWSKSYLRPKYYKMDEDELKRYFDSVDSKMSRGVRERELANMDRDRHKASVDKAMPTLSGAMETALSLLDTCHRIFEQSGVLSKSIWAWRLERGNLLKVIDFELANIPKTQLGFKGIGLNAVKSLAGEEYRGVLERFEPLHTEMFEKDDASRKNNPTISIEQLQKLTAIMVRTIVNTVYVSYVDYLSSNGKGYIEHYYSNLNEDVSGLTYSRPIVEFCNRMNTIQVAKDVFDKTGAKEVLVGEFPYSVMLKETARLLKAFEGVEKGGI